MPRGNHRLFGASRAGETWLAVITGALPVVDITTPSFQFLLASLFPIMKSFENKSSLITNFSMLPTLFGYLLGLAESDSQQSRYFERSDTSPAGNILQCPHQILYTGTVRTNLQSQTRVGTLRSHMSLRVQIATQTSCPNQLHPRTGLPSEGLQPHLSPGSRYLAPQPSPSTTTGPPPLLYRPSCLGMI